MSKLNASVVAVALAAAFSPAHATGIFAPNRWLEFGGVAASSPPEFMWDIEVRRLALDFAPPEKRVVPDPAWFDTEPPKNGAKPALAADEPHPQPEEKQTDFLVRLMDHRDFADALKQGLIKASDPAQALAQNDAVRLAIFGITEATATITLPAEAASEFADYHRAAAAYRQGVAHWGEAVKTLQDLLARPAGERQYRSVWAAYMLAKIALFREEDNAAESFQKVRALAKEGFKDSIGLAADSYGWEALHELKHDHAEKAARLYLTQLALGDMSAIVSLKALIPDRVGIDGMMNYGPNEQPPFEKEALEKWEKERNQRLQPALLRSARDPLLCQLQSAHVLATGTTGIGGWWDTQGEPERAKLWLKTVESAGIDSLEDAGRLGWVAYAAGDYDQARRWLKRNKQTTETSLWLEAKLARRNGDLKQAATLMSQVVAMMRKSARVYTPVEDGNYVMWSEGFSFREAASGELGSLHLSRAEFINSLAEFLDGNLWPDACYVAERVLTVDELKSWVDAHPSPPPAPETTVQSLALVLARRLVREDRYAEARSYFDEAQQKVLDSYTTALTKGANEKLTKKERARAWFDAAVIARTSGMEFMGTEFEPDGAGSGGDFEPTNVAGEREAGIYERSTWEAVKLPDGSMDTKEVKHKEPVAVGVSAEEKQRLTKFKPLPNKRYHYRYIAAALAWKAALLLPDQSDELADVLNTAGTWIKKDDKAADKYFQAIERRAGKTALGKQAGAAHWFVEHYGPWSVAPKE